MFHLVTAIMGIVDSSPSPIPISMDAPTPLASSFRRSLADASPPPPPPPHPPLLPPLLPPHPPLFPPLLPPPSPPPPGEYYVESQVYTVLIWVAFVCVILVMVRGAIKDPKPNKINTNQKHRMILTRRLPL